MNNFIAGLRRSSLLAIAGLMMTILVRRFLRARVETLIGIATSQMMNEILKILKLVHMATSQKFGYMQLGKNGPPVYGGLRTGYGREGRTND